MEKVRVLALLGVVALLVSSCTPPSDDTQRSAELEKQVEELRTENAELRGEITALKTKKKIPSEKKEEAKYTREEFKKLVMGRTKDQVMDAVGRPASTSEGGGFEFWYYKHTTYDPISQKIDSSIQVCFKGGVVESISF